MYSVKNLLTKKPAEITGALISLVDLAVVVNLFTISANGVAALNIALLGILGLFVTSNTVPTGGLQEVQDAVKEREEAGFILAVDLAKEQAVHVKADTP
jgi:hypothetical protein